MKKLSFLLIVFYFSTLSAQTIEWQKSYGGSNNDWPTCIRQTHNGGYIIAGWTSSNDYNVTGQHGAIDYWIVSLDSMGVMNWEKCFGGSSSDKANSIEETKDNGYVVSGSTQSNDGDVTGNHGGFDYWIVKLDSTGSIQWQKALGGSYNEEANCVKQTNDKGYIIAGYTTSTDGDVSAIHGGIGIADYWIVKLDTAGSIQWQKSLGGSSDDRAYSIQQTTDGGYIVAGQSISVDGDVTGNQGSCDYWIVKLNPLGIIQWQKSFGGSNIDVAYSVRQTNDNGYIIAGYTESIDGDINGNHGNEDCWIIKLDSTGTLQWQRAFGGVKDDGAREVQLTNDSCYIIAGYTLSNDGDVTGNHGGLDYWLIKINTSGIIQWQKPFGGSNFDDAFSVQQTHDGNYIIAGESDSFDGDATVCHGYPDYWIIKLGPNVGIENYSVTNGITLYPNPTSDRINIQSPQKFGQIKALEIFDRIGQLQLEQTDDFTDINISSLTNGLYFIVLTNFDNERITSKIIKE